jgi:hypothetical protein
MKFGQKPKSMTAEYAEEIGSRALLFLAEDQGRLGAFLSASGLDPAELHSRARSPEMLAAVLGHILADESTLLAFATNGGLQPEDVARAEIALGGTSPWDSV